MKTFPQSVRGAFGIALLLCTLVACKTPDNVGPGDFGTVTGRVIDIPSMLPISGATVTVGNIVTNTAASDQGGFVLRNVPVGTTQLEIDHTGWQHYRTTIVVTKNQATDIGVIGLPSSLTTR